MSLYLLFCVAQIPSSTLDTLLRTPHHNFFSLVRDPSQSQFDTEATNLLVRPFYSGFANWTSGDIREFIAKTFPETSSPSNLEPGQYALLDDRSAVDQTVRLAHSYSSLHMRNWEAMNADERARWEEECEEHPDAADDAWREWRVSFTDAEKLSTILSFEQDFTPKLYSEDFVAAHTDEQGVFHLEPASRDFLEHDISGCPS
ncbi:hypothetical protein KC361_g4779 [Hortaea werneckii]|nr:hypothetical protein KC361_g4779 [Hortaea werneckii]